MDLITADTRPQTSAGTTPARITDSEMGRRTSGLDAALERGVTWILGLLLCFSITFMGGRYDWGWLAWGEFVFVGTATLATALWLVRLAIRPQLGFVFSWSLILLAAGGIIGILQLSALPHWLLRLCSPGLPSILSLWCDDGAGGSTLGAWTCLSVVPSRTAESLRYYALYCLTFFLVLQNIRTLTSIKRFLQAIYFVAFATALFGFAQYFLWNGKSHWFFEIPFSNNSNDFRGPYTNKNHFAGLLAMAVGPGCYWLLSALGLLSSSRSSSSKTRDFLIPIGCVGLSCLLVASFLSVSRGGIIATTIAFVVAAGGLTFFIRSGKLWLFVAILTCVTFAGFLSFAGTEHIQQRMATLDPDRQLNGSMDSRIELWLAFLKAVPDFPVLGTGFGTHQYVYQLYYEKGHGIVYTHAENSYLQLLTEGGIVTLIVLGLALCCLCYWCIISLRAATLPESKPCMVAIMAALAAAAFHGMVDFVWYLPSHALLLSVLAGLACALARMQRPGNTIPLPIVPRFWAGAAGVACTILCIAWIQASYHHAQAALFWTEFQLGPDGEFAAKNPPAEKTFDDTPLVAALKESPNHPEFHAALGELYLQRCLQSKKWTEFSMPLSQVAAAVQNSRFETPEKRNRWLDTVYGSDNRKLLEVARDHFGQAVKHYPLNAPAYLRMAQLQFLAPTGVPSSTALLAQAVKADPHNPDVTYQAGVEYFQRGDDAQAMTCWHQCSFVSEKHKQTILAQLAVAVPLASLVEQFQPDYGSLLWLAREPFAGKGQRKDRLYLLTQARQLTLKESNPAVVGSRMCELHQAFLRDAEQEQALQCARAAVAAEPCLLSHRLLLARWLFQQGQFNEAKTELEWCRVREPGNTEVRALRSAVFDALHNNRKSIVANPIAGAQKDSVGASVPPP
jgi:O-antigen ligase/tetratricopeptide (TPR) repeat protein